MSREEVLDMVRFQCEDNYGEELTEGEVRYNWDALVEALQSEGSLPRDYPQITKAEISRILRKVG